MIEALLHFNEINGGFPNRVVVYRTGVAQSQVMQLSSLEIQIIVTAL